MTQREYMPILGGAIFIRMNLLNEDWADRNHGQSLDKLAERGGLSMAEAAAIIQKRKFSPSETLIESLQIIARASGRTLR